MSYRYIQPKFSQRNLDRETFTSEAEIASIFCLAEERRKKKGLLGGTEENLTHLLRTNYPIYAIRWANRSILIDGLGSTSTNIVYKDLIDTREFIKNLLKASDQVGSFRSFLSKNANTFKEFKSNRQMQLNYVISDIPLLTEITDFVKKSVITTEPPKDTSVFFRVDKQMVRQIISEFDALVKKVDNDIESLEEVDSYLHSSIDTAKNRIIEDKQNEYNNYNYELEKLTPSIKKEIEELTNSWDEELLKIKTEADEESKPIISEKEKYERELKKLSLIEAECVDERKALNQRLDRIGEDYWSKEAAINKAQKSEIWKVIKDSNEKLEKIKFKQDAKTKRLNDNFERAKGLEEEKIREIEIHREAALDIKERIIKEIDYRYSIISSQLSNLLEIKRKNKSKLSKMTSAWVPEQNSIILVPLYLIKYQNYDQLRYDIRAPSIINSSNVIKKNIRKTFWSLESKILNLMAPIGKEFDEFFTKSFINIISTNKKFEEIISQTLEETNIFHEHNRGKLFGTGLESLKREGWLNNDEYKKILSALNLSYKLSSKED
jgi:hypothetical protein